MRHLSIPFLITTLLLFANCSTENTPIYTLSTNVNPSEAGSVNPASGEYEDGTTIEIIATPNEHWVFNGWQGDHTGNQNPATILMDSNKSITAQFIKREYPLSINIEGDGSVQEEVIQQKATDYPHGTIVQLTANPSEGWEFIEWTGDAEGNENPQIITVHGETAITALFEQAEYVIDLNLEGNGEIIINPERDLYEYGEEISITVNPESDWYFVHWKGDLEGTENPVQLTITQHILATAVLDNSPFDGGNGSVQYPYQISTIDQLQEVRNYPDKHFVQLNDIDASETVNWSDGPFKGFIPIGKTQKNPFTGSYNGNEFEITGLLIERPGQEFTGLFGYVSDAQIKNLLISDAHIIGGTWAGGVVAYNIGGEIHRVGFTGKVQVISDVGGFFVGGVAGWNEEGEIIESFADSNVSGKTDIGGLVGFNLNGMITRSFATGEVSGKGAVGGLTGTNTGIISDSYSTAIVTGNSQIGGHTGLNTEEGFISHSYAAGSVSGSIYTGGFVGENLNAIESGFWDTETTGQVEGIGNESSGDVTGLTTSQMTGTSAMENMPEFDWEKVWKTISHYPILRWQDE